MRKSAFAIFQILLLSSLSFTSLEAADIYRTVDGLSVLIENLSDLDKETLIVKNELTRFYYKDEAVGVWLPSAKMSENIKREITNIDPNIGVETIRIMPIPERLGDVSSEERLMLNLYNTIRQVSTIEGIDYYSASRGHTRTFFKEFYVVDKVNSTKKLPDPLVKSVPEKDTIIVLQQDLTFGKNYSELTYRHADGYISLSIMNMKTMWYGIIPLIAPNNMQIHLIIRPIEDFILFYGNSAVKTTISAFGIEKSKTESFQNRIIALYNWFSKQVE